MLWTKYSTQTNEILTQKTSNIVLQKKTISKPVRESSWEQKLDTFSRSRLMTRYWLICYITKCFFYHGSKAIWRREWVFSCSRTFTSLYETPNYNMQMRITSKTEKIHTCTGTYLHRYIPAQVLRKCSHRFCQIYTFSSSSFNFSFFCLPSLEVSSSLPFYVFLPVPPYPFLTFLPHWLAGPRPTV